MDTWERLRAHPESRFAAPHHLLDLAAKAERLKRESPAGEEGHRQETLYKHGGTTVALFVFERLTHLPPHCARGVVLIQVLRGHLGVAAGTDAHDLHTGHFLALAPGVEHNVVAYEESEMLLTVHLDPR
jgi:quercetin dioxygenase-like cupin family protein